MTQSINYNRNVAVIKALRNAGANFEKLHAIEHHLYCYTLANFDLAMSLGVQYGYSVAHEGKVSEEESRWQLDLVKLSTPEIESVERQSAEIEAIAEQADADYDGWGTEVQK